MIQYSCQNTDTLFYNKETIYIPQDKLYIIDERMR